jgi:pyruvate/2-oxoglutarate dehydrogenase complex dihydrolipoamide acyltransferase (E2) component
MPYRVGQDVDAWCTKCRLDVTHVIVALASDGETPKRVECTSCGGQHNYRAPKAVKPPPRPGELGDVQRRALAAAAATKAVAAATADAKPAGSKPTEVEAPAKAPAPARKKAPPRRAARAAKGPSKEATAAKARDYNKHLADADLAAARPYSMRQSFALGEVIEHPSFGIGFVVDVLDATKVGILFEGGRRVLVMGHRPPAET